MVDRKEVKRLIKQGKYLSGEDDVKEERGIVKVRVGGQGDYVGWLRSFEEGGTGERKRGISFSGTLKVREFFRGDIIGSKSESDVESRTKGVERAWRARRMMVKDKEERKEVWI